MENKESNNKDLEKNCLELVNYLLHQYYEEYPFRENEVEERVNKFIDIAAKAVLNIKRQVNPNPDDEIYSGDLIILSIDNGKPEQYLLTRSAKSYENENKYPVDVRQNFIVRWFEIISDYSTLGKELLGRYVGDEFTYSTDDDKKEHTVKILEHRRCEDSLRVPKVEIEAEEVWKIKHKK